MAEDDVEVTLSPERFRELVTALRPELHRFCARMTGSVADGEDIVQDVLVRAHASLSDLKRPAQLRSWLFRIAHNRAIDHMRAYERRMAEPLVAIEGRPQERDPAVAADDQLLRDEIVHLALSRFVELPLLQRSCVILKDVLEHSLEEMAELLGLSVPAVQAALHRGRVRLQRLLKETSTQPVQGRRMTPTVSRYAQLFNARDWDGVRAMLAEDVRLDVVSRLHRKGRSDVSSYFTNYAQLEGWGAAPAWLDGREVVVMFRARGEAASYFVELLVCDERVVSIRDYRHVPYIGQDARFELA
ncbi:MAG: sigma-70 family RNA polymerase sigma factor [Kofleriaceae bacterium]